MVWIGAPSWLDPNPDWRIIAFAEIAASYAVSQRTREIGIRMALRARPSHVLCVFLRQFSYPLIAGLLVGIGGAAALSKLLRGQLYGISNLDPATYLVTIAIFPVTVAVASLWPARRALRIDPLRALRYD
jgi:ABC-type antimicrobial peptide transport system permease subunit